MSARDRRLLLALAALALVMGALPSLGVHSDVLLAAPALALALPLLAGRYLGAERLTRWARALHRPRRRRAGSLPVPVPRAPRILPRGGRLIATALAVRPPPASLLV